MPYFIKVLNWFQTTIANSRKGFIDVAYSMVPQVARAIAGFAITIMIARGLGPTGLGQYALAYSFSDLVFSLSDLGIGQTAIRYASRAFILEDTDEQFAILRWAFRIRLILVFFIVFLLFLLAPFIANQIWHLSTLTGLIRLSLFAGVFGALAGVPTIYFQSQKRFDMVAKILLLQTIISMSGFLFLAIINQWSVSLVIILNLVATGVGAIIFLFSIPKKAYFTIADIKHITKARILTALRGPLNDNVIDNTLDHNSPNSFATYMLLASILIMAIMRVDVWLMGVFLTKDQIGVYTVAARFTIPLIMVLSATNTALWPRVSNLVNYQAILILLNKIFRLCALLACFCFLYSIFFPLLTPLLLGSKYNSSIFLGQLLCMRYTLAILFIPVALIGYSFGLVKIYFWMNLLQLIVVVTINIFLLPIYGPIGSAIALIVNEMIGLTITGFFVNRKISSFRKKCYV